jgi:hypothetical protein
MKRGNLVLSGGPATLLTCRSPEAGRQVSSDSANQHAGLGNLLKHGLIYPPLRLCNIRLLDIVPPILVIARRMLGLDGGDRSYRFHVALGPVAFVRYLLMLMHCAE